MQPDYVTIETPLFLLTVGSNGRVSGYGLKQYHLASGGPVLLTDLQPGRVIGTPDFDFGGYNLHSLEKTHFAASKTRIDLQSGQDSVVFIRTGANGERIELTYAVNADKYGFDLVLRTEGLKVPENGEFQVRWLGGVPHTEPDPTRDLQYAGAYARVGDDVEKIAVASDPRKEFTATGQTFFVAVRSKYFMAALIPATPAAGADLLGLNPAPKSKTAAHYYDLTLREAWKGNATGRWSVYWGPIKHGNLEAFNVGLEGTMNWGWPIIRPISKLVLWALEALGRVIPNYGLVIIIFSVLVKVILWPLTRKSQVSMKKMAALQPEIKDIRELHAKNPQAMNAAIMKLYKDRGVNPASGCLPILLQMPVLYSLFIIFSTTIEFRQAPFMLLDHGPQHARLDCAIRVHDSALWRARRRVADRHGHHPVLHVEEDGDRPEPEDDALRDARLHADDLQFHALGPDALLHALQRPRHRRAEPDQDPRLHPQRAGDGRAEEEGEEGMRDEGGGMRVG